MILFGETPAVELEGRNMSAHDFAAAHAPKGPISLMFGTNKHMTAKALRELADKLERDEVHVLGAKVLTVATSEDFTRSVLRLSFVESVKVKA
jgi:hypothetical protein